LPFHDALKPRKSNPVNGKPPTTATIPATTDCHFTNPNTKSTTAQIEKKARGVGRFISPALCSTLHNLGDSNRKRQGKDEHNRDVSPVDVLNFLEVQRLNPAFMTTVDVLVAIPVIPLVPMFITWWLPWEQWIPWGKLPKLVLGPYVLYAGFAAWHFHFSDWFVLLVIVVGVVLTIMGVVEEAPATLPSTTDKTFLKTLENWLRGQSEIIDPHSQFACRGKQVFRVFYVVRCAEREAGSVEG
jgi:hypothetical protein